MAGVGGINLKWSHGLLDWPIAQVVPKKFKVVGMDIHVVDHPLAASRLTLMRDARSDNSAFRAALKDLGTMLVYEASRDLAVENFDCETPVATAQGTRLQDPPIIVPIIRAGLGMVDPALSMIPDAQVGFIGMARDEETHEPVPYLEALPQDLTGRTVFVVDLCWPPAAPCCTPCACWLLAALPISPPSAWSRPKMVWMRWKNRAFLCAS